MSSYELSVAESLSSSFHYKNMRAKVCRGIVLPVFCVDKKLGLSHSGRNIG